MNESETRPRRKPQTRLILSLIALILIALPIAIVWRDLNHWDSAVSVTGKVVRITPEGPFLDTVTISPLRAIPARTG
jgi:hypothetical protein